MCYHDEGRIVCKDGGYHFLVLEETAGYVRLRFYIYFSTTLGGWNSDKAVPINTFSKVSVAYNADSVSNNPIFYLNEIALTTTETAAPVGTRSDDSAGNLIIGASGVAGGYAYDGYIGEVIGYKGKILNVSEGMHNYRTTKWRYK